MSSVKKGRYKDKSRMVAENGRMNRYGEDNYRRRVAMLTRASRDTMYKWAMWRMYLNEDMSYALSSAHARGEVGMARESDKKSNKHKSKTDTKKSELKGIKAPIVSNIASCYVRHPDAMLYGRMMKDLSSRNYRPENMERTLSNNFYLVYGLPRISLAKQLPQGVAELYATAGSYGHNGDEHLETDRCINKLFDFVSDEIREDNTTKAHRQPTVDINMANSTASVKTLLLPRDITDSDEQSLPLASKSRQFWEHLASTRPDIHEEGAEIIETLQKRQAISGDDLMKQKNNRPGERRSRELWRTVAARKKEIIQLRHATEDTRQNQSVPVPTKKQEKQESKPNQLWSLIFSKKNELAQMRRTKGDSEQQDHWEADLGQKKAGVARKNDKPAPKHFQDNFQKELEARLLKFRDKSEQDT